MTQSEHQYLHKHPLMPRIGQRLDERYELLDVLGEGGASVVYRARDVLAGGEVAVKVLSPRKSRDPDFSLRFQREARLLRELEHPNVVKVANVGTTENDCLFIVQELLEGADIAETLDRDGPLSPERVVHIARQVLHALLEAHQLGVVHRDLKPQNIILCEFPGSTDFVKVLDFGMAKTFAADGIETAPGQVLATPAYAAPELLSGGPATPAADIYALGLLCLEMLTGEQVVTSSTVWGIIAWQSSDFPVVIPTSVAEIPLARIIAKAVHKDRTKRFQNAREMLDALAAPETVDVSMHHDVESLRADTRRSRLPIIIMASILLAAVLGVGLWMGLTKPSRSNARDGTGQAVPDTVAVQTEACRQGDFDVCLEIGLGSPTPQGLAFPPEAVHEALARACIDGERPVACARLAEHWQQGIAVEADPEQASDYYVMACELGDTDVCLHAGYDHLNGTGLALDRRRARQLLTSACDADKPSACAGLAAIYANGWDVEPDLTRAAELYERACDADVAEACSRLGAMRQQGRGVAEDLDIARALYQRACDGDYLPACANLGTLFHRGLGVAVDAERARALYERACNGDFAPACAGLGTLFETGLGVDPHLERAVDLYQRACDGGEPIGCVSLARLIRARQIAGDNQQADSYQRRACEMGYQPACEADASD